MLLLATTAVLFSAVPQSAQDAPLQSFMPTGTSIWIETTDHAAILAQGLDHPLVREVTSSPLFELETKMEPEAALAAAEAALGVPPLSLASALSSGGAAFALVPDGNRQRPLLILRGSDADAFEDALETGLDLLDGLGALDEPTSGTRVSLGALADNAWALAGRNAAAVRADDKTLLISNNWKVILRALETRNDPERDALLSRVQRHRSEHASQDARTFAWFDLVEIEVLNPLKDLRQMAADPGAHLVLGPAITALSTAKEVSFTFEEARGELRLNLVATGSKPATGMPRRSAVTAGKRIEFDADPKQCASVRIYRDVQSLVDGRTELFEAKTLPAFAEGLAGIGLLVGGPDATDELIAALGNEFVIAVESPLDFEGSAKPDIPLPGACLIARLDDPELNGPRLVQAFQSLVALQNVERAMNGQPGLTLGLEPLGDVILSKAVQTPPKPGDGVDLSHNLAPGCCVAGGMFIVGTHHEVVARMVKRVRLAAPQAAAAVEVAVASNDEVVIDRVTIEAHVLEDLLTEHGEALEMHMVLNDGKSKERATAEAATLRSILARLDDVRLGTTVRHGERRSPRATSGASSRDARGDDMVISVRLVLALTD